MIGDFSGKDLYISWVRNPLNANTDIITKDYRVDVRIGGELQRVVYTTDTNYTYYYDDMVTDQGTPSRSVDIEVRERDTLLAVSPEASATFTNPLPAAPVITATPMFNNIIIDIEPVEDNDLAGYIVCRGTTPNFTPSLSNQIYRGTNINIVDADIFKNVVYYYKAAAFDLFDDTITELNFSDAANSFIETPPAQFEGFEFANITFSPTIGGAIVYTGGTVYKRTGDVVETKTVTGGSSSTYAGDPVYFYYDWDANTISNTTSISVALGTENRRILALWKGASNIVSGVREPIINGQYIIAESIDTSRVSTASFTSSGLAIFGNELVSDDFVPGVSGWKIDKDGNAEFNYLIVRNSFFDDLSNIFDDNQVGSKTGANTGSNLVTVFSQTITGIRNVDIAFTNGDITVGFSVLDAPATNSTVNVACYFRVKVDGVWSPYRLVDDMNVAITTKVINSDHRVYIKGFMGGCDELEYIFTMNKPSGTGKWYAKNANFTTRILRK